MGADFVVLPQQEGAEVRAPTAPAREIDGQVDDPFLQPPPPPALPGLAP